MSRSARRGVSWALVVLVAGFGTARAQEDEAGIAVGRTPGHALVEDLSAKPVDLSRLIGTRPALVEFWATWCPRCRALEPRVKAAYARYGGRIQFLVVAVAVNETLAGVRRHLVQHPVPYRFLWDAGGSAVRAFAAPTTSYMVVLGQDGRVAYTGVGEEQNFEAALARVAGRTP